MPLLLAPRFWGVHLLALVAVLVAGGLGYWQLEAWQARRAAEAVDLSSTDPVPMTSVIGPDDPFPGAAVGRPVVVEGTWLPDATVLVSGRSRGDRDGFWVVTPLTVGTPDAPAVAVVRGWAPTQDVVPAPPTGDAELVGWLQPGEGTGAVDDDPDDDVLPQLRTADIVQRVDRDLYGAYVVVADPAEVAEGAWPTGDRAVNDGSAGLAPADLEALPQSGRFTALRNLLYALEWWIFAGFAGFLWWRYVREVTAAATAVEADQQPEEHPVGSGP